MLGREDRHEADVDTVRHVSYVTNGGVDSSVTFPTLGCTSTKSEPIHLHWLQRDGETQSHSERIGLTTSFACASGYAYSCTSSFELHYTSGDVQFQRFDFTCTND